MQVQSTAFTTVQPAQPGQPTSATSAGAAAIDFQSFLTLLTAQLRNQDPLSPLDSTQFVAQLASFSTVEQLVTANSRLDSIAETLTPSGLQNYADWVGRVAEVQGAPAPYTGAPVAFRALPRTDASSVDLIVRGADGREIYRSPIANNDNVQIWSADSSVPAGLYTLETEYTFTDGSVARAGAAVFDEIDSVRLSADGPVIALSSGAVVSLDAVRGFGRAPGD